MYSSENIATVEEVHHIGSEAEFHSIKVIGDDVQMQNALVPHYLIKSLSKIWLSNVER